MAKTVAASLCSRQYPHTLQAFKRSLVHFASSHKATNSAKLAMLSLGVATMAHAQQATLPLTFQSSPLLTATLSGPNDARSLDLVQGESHQLLYDPDHGVVVGYAARSASTLMVELFLLNIGELDRAVVEADRLGKMKPHNFAKQQLSARYHVPQMVLCRGSKVAQATNVTASLKLVANPYVRAVSSFVHQMNTAISHECPRIPHPGMPVHPMCTELKISEAVTDSADTLMANTTFIQWLEAVQKVGFKALDMHTLPQSSQLESEPACRFAHVCKLEHDLQGCLDGVNAKSGANFSVAGLEQFISRQNSTVFDHRHKSKDAFRGAEEVAQLPWARLQALDGEPVASDWYRGPAGERATEIVRELYKVDFAMYNYPHGI